MPTIAEMLRTLRAARRAGETLTLIHADGRLHRIDPAHPMAYAVGGLRCYERWARGNADAPAARHFVAWHARSGAPLPLAYRGGAQRAIRAVASATGRPLVSDPSRMSEALSDLRKAVKR